MLIDATHPEETRVVVSENGRVEELDVDTSTKKQIKGNIYLAKIVRVEPSLQAAFVDYGGNRHGFLAFNEIHPDYYQIPVADREALKAMLKKAEDDEMEPIQAGETNSDVEVVSETENDIRTRIYPSFIKRYKIQEVIRQGQVMLVQVVKEERGNKGAALTTYLSLAGRFSVLMPNNGKGGGISRKITNVKDRKALRTIIDKFSIPDGMSVIIRTAGQGKTKTEIKRDYDYLIKTWMKIREETLESLAPKLIHEEGDIVKRSLRDVFTPDIDEIWVEGETVFKSAKEFMKMLMPAQAKKIKQYKGAEPIFVSNQVEQQLESIHNNIVQLKSGGYLVIDQTEALVAVDVNSGRATKEHDIEETALRTNLETCDELARQLRLRDMAGLIVIDFIDMEEAKNNAAVERRLKEALKKDRARIQVGKMSGFGLVEMSRQRLHSSFLESSYQPCMHCGGKGMIRSVESCAMHALHILEEAAFKNISNKILISLPPNVATYLLNVKRSHLVTLETKYNVSIQIIPDETLLRSSDYKLERVREDGERLHVNLNAPAKHELKEKRKQDFLRMPFEKDHKKQEKQQPALEPVQKETKETETLELNDGQQEKKNKNKRRSEWRKRRKEKRMLARMKQRQAAQQQENSQETFSPEEKFTVVEQKDFFDFKKEEMPINEVETTPVQNEEKEEKKSASKGKKKTVKKEEKISQKPDTETGFDKKEESLSKEKESTKKVSSEKSAKTKPVKGKQVKSTKKTNEKEPSKKKSTTKEVKEVAESEKKPLESTIIEKGEDNTPEGPRKKGWWNKLVN